MNISILTDNSKSWFLPYGHKLKQQLVANGHRAEYVYTSDDIPAGDICFLLSCSRIVNNTALQKNLHNIVVHASDLPQGKGFAPLQWQILAGMNSIMLTLFEVVEKVDAGPYYLKESLIFNGTELYNELREKLALKIIDMCLNFVANKDSLKAIPQTGVEGFYPKRTVNDDQLNPNKTISEQFNHFRIADNENYPLWFTYLGRKYYVKIYGE